ncbi:MAG: DNA mismatch repair endonuclease MutL [Treponemataceae bacterium]|nr:DNA mismatch repair endonuclease MutL [Treponemataceae bacterium]
MDNTAANKPGTTEVAAANQSDTSHPNAANQQRTFGAIDANQQRTSRAAAATNKPDRSGEAAATNKPVISVATAARRFSPVRTLPPEVARKIAAGEVIDRPASIIRELLDNAVDSGADMITTEITGGGIERIMVTDNGCGMSKTDLEACAHPHTTSKITAETDLLTLTTLGFRGEALASIAAVSRLEITSRRETEENAWKAVVPPAGVSANKITPASRAKGTTVQSEALFENIPARRLFLKRPASETNLCRQIFIEKALPRTDISFRLICDGKTKYELPSGHSFAERFVEAFDITEPPSFFSEISGKSSHSGSDGTPDWTYRLILGSPSVCRNDKRLLLIYVNGRRVQEFSLVQAIEYGATGYFPNGTHPAAVLFLDMKPSLVDFNIHPAKKEVRFKDISEAHHAISTAVRNFYRSTSDIQESTIETDIDANEPDLYSQREYEQKRDVYENRTSYADFGIVAAEREETYSTDRDSVGGTMGDPRDSIGGTYGAGNFGKSPDFVRENSPYSAQNPQTSRHYPDKFSFPHTAFQSPIITIPKSETDGGTNSPISSLANFAEEAHGTNSSIADFTAPSTPSANSLVSHSANFSGDINTTTQGRSFRYLGQIFSVFLVVEKDNELYLIDQHAAHERYLFDKFMKNAGLKQPLLIPYKIATESEDDDNYLESISGEMEKAGFIIKKADNIWEISTVPQKWQGTEDYIKRALLEERKSPSEIIRTIAAYSSCRAAVMEGDYLDRETAENIIEKAFELPDPHCPHGRPVWIRMTKENLYALVKRT